MNKWYGVIGYAVPVNDVPGVYEEEIVEREYSGDVLQLNRRLQQTSNVNDDIQITKRISILSDPYADMNFLQMRYLEFMGTKWKVTSVDPQYPRLVLDLGGVWNGN